MDDFRELRERISVWESLAQRANSTEEFKRRVAYCEELRARLRVLQLAQKRAPAFLRVLRAIATGRAPS